MITNVCSECSIDFPHSSDGASILFSEASDQYTAVAQLKSGIYSNIWDSVARSQSVDSGNWYIVYYPCAMKWYMCESAHHCQLQPESLMILPWNSPLCIYTTPWWYSDPTLGEWWALFGKYTNEVALLSQSAGKYHWGLLQSHPSSRWHWQVHRWRRCRWGFWTDYHKPG